MRTHNSIGAFGTPGARKTIDIEVFTVTMCDAWLDGVYPQSSCGFARLKAWRYCSMMGRLDGIPCSMARTQSASSPYTVEVLNKAFDILGVFRPEAPSLSLKQIVALTGLPKTTTFRLLSTLVERQFCEYDPATEQYSLGFAFLRFGDIRRRQTNVHANALPVMRDMRNKVNETIVLSIRTGDFRIHIDFVESLHPMRRMAELGVQAPLYAGAASKVLLAGLEADELESYLARTELEAFQKATITDKEELKKELLRIQAQGYAESLGELFTGGGALAAPVRDYSGKTVAVIDILTPEHRYTPEHREQCIAHLLEGTAEISRRLGYQS
jgi:DNA-binding IclR family transcriptional regulator